MSYDPPGAASGVPVYTDGSNAMAANLNLDSHKIVNVTDPSTDQEAATKKYVDDAIVAGGGYTDEQAQDAVGTILADTATVNLTYTDATPEIKADVLPGGIKLDDLAAPDDTTDLDVSTSLHGLVPKITGSDGYVLTKSSTAAVWSAGGSGASLAQSKLAGRGSASGSGVYEEIALGTNLSMSGTTLNASGSGGASAQDFIDTTWCKKFFSDASILPATERVAASLAAVPTETSTITGTLAKLNGVATLTGTLPGLVYWDLGALRSEILFVATTQFSGGLDIQIGTSSSAPSDVNPDGYYFYRTTAGNLEIHKRVGGSGSALVTTTTLPVTALNPLGMALYYKDSTGVLEAYCRVANGWFRILATTDSTYTTQRYVWWRYSNAGTGRLILPITAWSD